MVTPVVPLEPHELGTRTACYCERCGTFAAVEVDTAIVDGRDLTVIQRVTSLRCLACGHTDRWR